MNIYILKVSYLAGTLAKVIERCVVGASILEICEFGDNRINEEASKINKKNKEMKKGTFLSNIILKIWTVAF